MIIVGAGPVGSTVAEAIAKEGYDVLVLEEHPKIGLPQHCTGKVSVNALKEFHLPEIVIIQEVRGAIFYSPDMSSLSVERKDTQAYILNRTTLDMWLSEKAVYAGATLLTDARATNVSIDTRRVSISFKHNGGCRELTARIVIGADGAGSSIARRLGLLSKESSTVKVAIQKEIVGLHDLKSDFVEVYMGRRYAPGFFAWIVPTGENNAKVGLGVNFLQSRYLPNYLESFIMSHPIAHKKLEGGHCTIQTTHIIPTGGTLRQTISNGALIVGDAAGQVKSTTGGGIYYGMLCAKFAGQVVSKALSLDGEVIKKDALMGYEDLWMERLGREIATSVKLRLLLDSLTDDDLNYLFNIAREDEALIDMIENEGDIDWQSKLSASTFKHIMKALVKRPQLLIKFGKFLAS